MYCNNCKKEVIDSTIFCPYCGTKLDASASVTSSAPMTANKKAKKGIVVLLLALLVLVSAIGGAIIFALFSNNGDDRDDSSYSDRHDKDDDESSDEHESDDEDGSNDQDIEHDNKADETAEDNADDSAVDDGNIDIGTEDDPSVVPITSEADPSADAPAIEVVGRNVIMPNLVDMLWDDAVALCDSYLNLKAEQEWSEYPKDYIFEQEFPEGRQIELGATVIVKISKGMHPVEVADLTDFTVDAAERQLKKDGFKVNKTYAQSDDVAKDHVIRTEPPAHEMAPQGSYVTLIVSLGAPNTLIVVPKLIDLPIETALDRCEEYFLSPVIEMVDSEEEEGTVLEQSILPNELVEKNTEITLKVSTGKIPETTKKFSFTVPQSAEGEFEFRYYIDGILDAENSGEIYDVSLIDDKGISYEITGRDGEVKSLAIKVTSTKTGLAGTYLVVEFTFTANDEGTIKVKNEIVEKNTKIFAQLLDEESDGIEVE